MSLDKIKEQVEFYFSDSNYAKDKFLQDVAAQNNKCVPISVLMTFNRMKVLNPTLEKIKDAVKDSDIVEVIDDMLKKIETPEYLEYRSDAEVSKKVVHMRGFDINMNLDDIKEMLKSHCNPVKITMRRDSDKKFKGSCFVEFRTIEEASNILDSKIECSKVSENDDSAKKIKKDTEYLEIKSKDEYLQSKKEEKGDKKEENFANKVKADFIPKLYKYETESELQITELKDIVSNVAFVDINKKIIRMKFREDWDENTFEKGGKSVKLIKLNENEAQDYVKDINIKRIPKRK